METRKLTVEVAFDGSEAMKPKFRCGPTLLPEFLRAANSSIEAIATSMVMGMEQHGIRRERAVETTRRMLRKQIDCAGDLPVENGRVMVRDLAKGRVEDPLAAYTPEQQAKGLDRLAEDLGL